MFATHGIDMEDDAGLAREKARLGREFWPKFRRFAARLPFAEDLVAVYFCAFDRNTPRRVQVALIGALVLCAAVRLHSRYAAAHWLHR